MTLHLHGASLSDSVNATTLRGDPLVDIRPDYTYFLFEKGQAFAFDVRELNHILSNPFTRKSNPFTGTPITRAQARNVALRLRSISDETWFNALDAEHDVAMPVVSRTSRIIAHIHNRYADAMIGESGAEMMSDLENADLLKFLFIASQSPMVSRHNDHFLTVMINTLRERDSLIDNASLNDHLRLKCAEFFISSIDHDNHLVVDPRIKMAFLREVLSDVHDASISLKNDIGLN
jgi:hypothetical protein